MRVAPFATVLSVAALGAVSIPAASAAAPACGKTQILELAKERAPDAVNAALAGGGGVARTCRDLNGDGRKDALFVLVGGRSGGAFFGGIVGGAGNGPSLLAWSGPYGKTTFGFFRSRPALAWPVYREGDANCCPSGGWRVRRFVSSGGTFRALKAVRLRSDRMPLNRKP
jgi:hypothetical protein